MLVRTAKKWKVGLTQVAEVMHLRLRKIDNIMSGEESIMLIMFFLKVLFYFILFVVDLFACLKYGTSKNIRSLQSNTF